MKKQMSLLGMLGLVLALGVMVAGCATTQTYDNSVAEEKQCSLIISQGVIITSFDEKSVYWQGPLFPLGKSTIKIPAGKHTLAMDIGRPVDFEFAAEKTYTAKIPLGRAQFEISAE